MQSFTEIAAEKAQELADKMIRTPHMPYVEDEIKKKILDNIAYRKNEVMMIYMKGFGDAIAEVEKQKNNSSL